MDAQALKSRGNELYQKGKFGAAIEAYTEAITCDPRWTVLYINRALCHRKKKDWASVKRDCETALHFDRNSVKALYMLGLALSAEKKCTEAANSLQRAREEAREADDKRAMRGEIRGRLREMDAKALRAADEAIDARLRALEPVRDARRVGAYLASARLREVSTSAFVARKTSEGSEAMVFSPIVDDASSSSMRMLHVCDQERDVERGAYDLPEPRETYESGVRRLDAVRDVRDVGALDVIIVPGVAFGEDGRRLGRGGGYYDAFLTRYVEAAASVGAPPPLIVALAYGCQIYPRDRVPVRAHDRLVDVIVTDTRAIACTESGSRALGAATS